MKFRIERRGSFWVLKNYIPAKFKPNCYETITYTTHGDFSFLDNLVPLLQRYTKCFLCDCLFHDIVIFSNRWKAPISIAIYSPGTDYDTALNSVLNLRNCATGFQLIQQFVSFHFYFDRTHTPKNVKFLIVLLTNIEFRF